MEWWQDLYDDLRLRTTFGRIPQEQTSREVDFIEDVLSLHKGASVLDLCCGIGRHSIELAKRGYGVTGVDLSKEYLKRARERAKEERVKVKFVQKDMREVDFSQEFDGAINMLMSFGFFEREDENIRVIEGVQNSLKKGGKFLIELMNRDWLLRNFRERDWREVEGVLIVEEREFDLASSRVNAKLTYIIEREERVEKRLNWRFYSFQELKRLLEENGLHVVASYGSPDKNELTLATRVMRIVSEKTG